MFDVVEKGDYTLNPSRKKIQSDTKWNPRHQTVCDIENHIIRQTSAVSDFNGIDYLVAYEISPFRIEDNEFGEQLSMNTSQLDQIYTHIERVKISADESRVKCERVGNGYGGFVMKNRTVATMLEYAKDKILATIQPKDLIIIEAGEEWKELKRIVEPHTQNIGKNNLVPIPGFNEVILPFIVCSGSDYYTLINVQK